MYNQLPIRDNFDMIVIILNAVPFRRSIMSEFIVDLVRKFIRDILDNLGIPDKMVNPLYNTILAAYMICIRISEDLI